MHSDDDAGQLSARFGDRVATASQIVALMLVSLVAGTTFGIWQGYNPVGFSATAFLETHQQVVRGLNVLLPAMAAVSIVLVIGLCIFSRKRRSVAALYLAAAVLMIVAGAITRLGNQPINAQVMEWTLPTMPTDWPAIRDRWWHWHVTRTLIAMAAEIVLILAIFRHRRRR